MHVLAKHAHSRHGTAHTRADGSGVARPTGRPAGLHSGPRLDSGAQAVSTEGDNSQHGLEHWRTTLSLFFASYAPKPHRHHHHYQHHHQLTQPPWAAAAAAAPPTHPVYTYPGPHCRETGQMTSRVQDNAAQRSVQCQSPQCRTVCFVIAGKIGAGISTVVLMYNHRRPVKQARLLTDQQLLTNRLTA